MFDTCTAYVWNVYQLYSLKSKKKKNVTLGCLKQWVYVPNDMCIHLPLKSIQYLSALIVKGISYDTICT